MIMFFQSRSKLRKAAKATGKKQLDKGVAAPTGKRWALKLK